MAHRLARRLSSSCLFVKDPTALVSTSLLAREADVPCSLRLALEGSPARLPEAFSESNQNISSSKLPEALSGLRISVPQGSPGSAESPCPSEASTSHVDIKRPDTIRRPHWDITAPHSIPLRQQGQCLGFPNQPCAVALPAQQTTVEPNRTGQGLVFQRYLTTSVSSYSPAGVPTGLLLLNDLRPAEGSTHKSKRLGRGMGSGKGKTAGRGHKGQKARSGNKPKIGFEGGQTPLRLRLPKRGFHNLFSADFQVVNLKDVVAKVQAGDIDPNALITMKTLKDVGLGGKAMRDGIKLLARGAETVDMPLHFEVSRVSDAAKHAVVTAGGSVTRVHYNTLGLRALLKPEWFAKKGRILPRAARPPPRITRLGLVDCVGRLPAPTQRQAVEPSL